MSLILRCFRPDFRILAQLYLLAYLNLIPFRFLKRILFEPLMNTVGQENNPYRNRDRYRNRNFMALGHEKLEVYRLAAMLSRLGKRGYSVQEGPSSYGIDPDFDSDFDPDEIKSQPDAALNADKPRE